MRRSRSSCSGYDRISTLWLVRQRAGQRCSLLRWALGAYDFQGAQCPPSLYAFIAEAASINLSLKRCASNSCGWPWLRGASQVAMLELLGDDGERVIQEAREVGFLSTDQTH